MLNQWPSEQRSVAPSRQIEEPLATVAPPNMHERSLAGTAPQAVPRLRQARSSQRGFNGPLGRTYFRSKSATTFVFGTVTPFVPFALVILRPSSVV